MPEIPPWITPQDLPDNLITATLLQLNGWWLHLTCPCGRASAYPLRLLASLQSAGATLGAVRHRFICERCGARPETIFLVDHPDYLADGVAGATARVHALP
jgi:hypothetical protein